MHKEQNISQKELCKNIGISRATLSSFKNGIRIDIGLKRF
ncbi:helix-turn-helix domain-containing protein [Sulfurimonas sp.]|nr:helix-turn-helix transcriptional regulator [Sulfurimonas sp.]